MTRAITAIDHLEVRLVPLDQALFGPVTVIEQPAYRCPACGVASYHPDDLKNHYCGYCHAFEADDEKLVQVLIDKALASHKANPALPRAQVLRALRLLQEQYHRRDVEKRQYPLTDGPETDQMVDDLTRTGPIT